MRLNPEAQERVVRTGFRRRREEVCSRRDGESIAKSEKGGSAVEIRTSQRAGLRRVLLVEDDDEMRAMLAFVLSRHGFHVTEACDGSRALNHLVEIALSGNRERTPDLLLTEQRLPGFCGLTVVEAARIARLSLRAILMTSSCDAEARNRAALLGGTRVLEKPFEVDELVSLIRSVDEPRTPALSAVLLGGRLGAQDLGL